MIHSLTVDDTTAEGARSPEITNNSHTKGKYFRFIYVPLVLSVILVLFYTGLSSLKAEIQYRNESSNSMVVRGPGEPCEPIHERQNTPVLNVGAPRVLGTGSAESRRERSVQNKNEESNVPSETKDVSLTVVNLATEEGLQDMFHNDTETAGPVGAQPLSMCGTDDRYMIREPHGAPHRSIAYLSAEYRIRGNSYSNFTRCTAFMVSSDTFMTAAHCVNNPGLGQIRKVLLTFGRTRLYPKTVIRARRTGYLSCYENSKSACDVGGGKLVNDLRDNNFALPTSAKPLPFICPGCGGKALICGFPKDLGSGMYCAEGETANLNGLFITKADTHGGMSGSPLFLTEGRGKLRNNDVVYGVYIEGTSVNCVSNCVKLRPDMVKAIREM